MSLEETLDFVNNPILNYDNEEWMKHPTYEDLEGSSFGRVRRTYKNETYIKTQYVKKEETTRNDLRFTSSINGVQKPFYSSIFILECFKGLKTDSSNQCDHKNSIPYDNTIDNLDWVKNGKENMGNKNTKIKMSQSHKGTRRKKIIMDYNDFNLNNQPGEKWKSHPVYKNIEVSNYGRVIERNKEKNTFFEKVKRMTSSGYLIVSIGKGDERINARVHRLVAETWIKNNDESKNEVDHINRDRTDNRKSNLRWVSRVENMNNSSNKTEKGKKVVRLDLNGKLINIYLSLREVCDKDNINKSRVKKCCEENSEIKSIKDLLKNGSKRSGYFFMFEDDYKNMMKKKIKESHIMTFDEYILL